MLQPVPGMTFDFEKLRFDFLVAVPEPADAIILVDVCITYRYFQVNLHALGFFKFKSILPL